MSEKSEVLRKRAEEWLSDFEHTLTRAGFPYEPPLLCVNEELGEVSCEWWGKDKKLTLFLDESGDEDEEAASYIRIDHYQTDPLHSPMYEGTLPNVESATLLWYWFTH